ncbi:MAG: ADP-forming succinate--CoA ligase subunit beta [Candidatus Marinimicrobia bacterium]|jgi:succinyl-CoA synthetase beta subunit|nr:ADP-forming succinate--CoA ligase subunit beta [Candidatus Neomarinimicrobiota bacterium]MBT3575048.1 ADP-forming succinate--CoA ligase subunit beta [Candidatus Neomarinimicrobiota bacterium]MBT3678820.1 ADP-forming succinate--CoA ligase subunit beta [Candidatus Neomarinimicrobiota bacterium]MBT3949934.1 ADP-forming succinate--CoA ligase subunit beta [Candidatus Neomarinimicrobiota bacterium]MBT4252637.1 ADP-forming succinate--CoA ligase subunit beta [Candidatus Neomarinimicrobiota bacterium
MNIHEYQAKEIFRKYNVPVPNGGVAYSVEEALNVAKSLDSSIFVVKAQIHAGGRGKAGGVKIAKNLDEVTLHANEILGKTLVTHQTGPAGKTVGRLLVEEGIDIARELYMGIVLDRQTGQFVFMVSVEGGMEIEKVASETPEKIIKEWIEPGMGLQAFQARKLAYALGLQGVQVREAVKFMFALWNAFNASDASLVEINPLVVTGNGHVMALDAKMNFDDNALYRQAEILEYRDLSEEEPSEVEASSYNLNYIKLDGNVGCMVNGAGLAMGTMDIIKLYGGEPANFLDVGGVANPDTVSNGFRIIMSDSNVKAVLINIFGGIVRCDRVAMGIILALEKVKVNVPIVVRLAGTNAEEGARLLANSDIDFIVATSLAEAAEKVTAAIKE